MAAKVVDLLWNPTWQDTGYGNNYVVGILNILDLLLIHILPQVPCWVLDHNIRSGSTLASEWQQRRKQLTTEMAN